MKTLAALYSEDPGSKDNAGQYDVNRGEKQWDPVFLAKAFALKEGQISAPFKTRFGYHIIQMVSRLGDDAVVRHILRVPRVSRSEVTESMKKLDSIRGKLIEGALTFGEAVAKHSEDESSKFTAGRKTNAEGSTLLTIDQLDKDLVGMINNLKVGEYSQAVDFTDERGKRGVRIVYIMSKTEPHRENLRDDYNRIALRALEEKKNDVLERWFLEQMPKYYIRVDEEYRECEQIKSWLKQALQKAETASSPK
jgi:peptidyl-prolyl cis-trans isomerase SurA